MKFVFIGDIEFGRSNKKHCKMQLPNNIIQQLNAGDALFFNLETVLLSPSFDKKNNSLPNKDIHIYNDNEDGIKFLKKNIKCPIFVSIINNHTFDFGLNGYHETVKLLDKNNYKFTVKKSYYIDDKIIYLNATDHWTIIAKNNQQNPQNGNLWDKNCLLIDNESNEEYTYKLLTYLNSIKKNRILIFSIHWGKNFQNNKRESTYLSQTYELFFKKLCDLGTDIVFGHGAHHINDKYYEIYNKKLIIYGLGDFYGDFVYKSEYHTDKSIILNYDTKTQVTEQILLSGKYSQYTDNHKISCKTPYILDYLNKEKNPAEGGNRFAHEIEMKELIPILKKYNIQINKIKKEIIYNNKTISYKDYFNNPTNKLTNYCSDKNLSKLIYEKYNIPYPKYVDIVDIQKHINSFQFPIILKPKRNGGGNGIIEDIENIDELNKNMDKLDNNNYIVQEQKRGSTYRILVFNNKVIYIKRSKPPFVIGNNKDTVETLINTLNVKLKNKNKGAYVKRISDTYIKKQGYTRKSIVPYGHKLYITNVINFWNGAHDYEFINIDDVHPMNIELFLKINKAFKLNMSGIDFITTSLSKPYYLSNGNVLEVNWKPSFRPAIEFFPEPFVLSIINNN